MPEAMHGKKLGLQLCKAMGLDATTIRRIEVIADVDEVARVVVHYLNGAASAKDQLVQTLEEYELAPRGGVLRAAQILGDGSNTLSTEA